MAFFFYKKFLFRLLKKCQNGYLVIEDNHQKYFFGNQKKKKAIIKVNNQSFYKRVVLYGDIGLGESFMVKGWETNSLYEVLLWFLKNSSFLPSLSNSKVSGLFFGFLVILEKIKENKNLKNNFKKSRSNISFHYDLSNDFFKLMLDKTMAYSSGVFLKQSDSLEEAQKNKYEIICQKLKLSKNCSLLEIGSGWGGLAVYAAKKYKCQITTLTISKKQFKYVKNLIKRYNLGKKIKVEFMDYRLKQGKFDKIVSIEMIEAIGYRQMATYIKKLDELLKLGGSILLQAITYPDHYFNQYVKKVNWIQKHIFPGSHLVSIQDILTKFKKYTSISLVDFEIISSSYARTLNHWREKIVKNKKKVLQLGLSETFFRKWIFYLIYCEVGFSTTYINDTQILLSKERENFYLQ